MEGRRSSTLGRPETGYSRHGELPSCYGCALGGAGASRAVGGTRRADGAGSSNRVDAICNRLAGLPQRLQHELHEHRRELAARVRPQDLLRLRLEEVLAPQRLPARDQACPRDEEQAAAARARGGGGPGQGRRRRRRAEHESVTGPPPDTRAREGSRAAPGRRRRGSRWGCAAGAGRVCALRRPLQQGLTHAELARVEPRKHAQVKGPAVDRRGEEHVALLGGELHLPAAHGLLQLLDALLLGRLPARRCGVPGGGGRRWRRRRRRVRF